jgi:hypothetical protein
MQIFAVADGLKKYILNCFGFFKCFFKYSYINLKFINHDLDGIWEGFKF